MITIYNRAKTQLTEINAPTLSGADLSGADLVEADLSGAELSGAELSGANLCRADLSGADLRRVNLSGADLSGANLCRADLCRADLSGADLRRVNLSGAELSGANLSGANLCRADLSGANGLIPPLVLLAWWGQVSDDLCTELMRYDATNHPDPETFSVWATGGECPYDSVLVSRSANFKEMRDLYSHGPALSAYKLMTRLFGETGVKWRPTNPG